MNVSAVGIPAEVETSWYRPFEGGNTVGKRRFRGCTLLGLSMRGGKSTCRLERRTSWLTVSLCMVKKSGV